MVRTTYESEKYFGRGFLNPSKIELMAEQCYLKNVIY